MNYNSYRRFLKNRYALSTVVTTLIILVISVLLASVVTYFAINVVSTRVQEESLTLTKQHIWLNSGEEDPTAPTYSMASVMVINTGGRDVVIDKIAVRGQDCAWTSDDKFVVYTITQTAVADDMTFQPDMDPAGGDLALTQGGTEYTFSPATTDLVLPSGSTMLVYIINPDSITINDIGLTVSITLYTAQAMYYREANVQAYVPPAA
jgi:hypothetical protein